MMDESLKTSEKVGLVVQHGRGPRHYVFISDFPVSPIPKDSYKLLVSFWLVTRIPVSLVV